MSRDPNLKQSVTVKLRDIDSTLLFVRVHLVEPIAFDLISKILTVGTQLNFFDDERQVNIGTFPAYVDDLRGIRLEQNICSCQ